MEEKIELIDESGDKKYFSQLPHYILNHSTAIDQALYWQMKRYSGENGKCFATSNTLMRKMGIGRKAYDKSLGYLIKKGWVKFVGTTKGRTRPIKTYAIVDIWKLNIDHYEEISVESTLSSSKEISAESDGDKSQKHTKISPRSTLEEELVEEEHIKKNTTSVEQPFNIFWTTYPKKVGRVVAERSFKRIAPPKELVETILQDVRSRAESEDWQKEGGKFIPYPATYLNQRRWEDEEKPKIKQQDYFKV